MKKIVLAVALLLLAVTATNAATPARHGGHKRTRTAQRTKEPNPGKAPGKTSGTTTGQSIKRGRLPNQTADPLLFDLIGPDDGEAIPSFPDDGTIGNGWAGDPGIAPCRELDESGGLEGRAAPAERPQ
jgi:hypothetical protein